MAATKPLKRGKERKEHIDEAPALEINLQILDPFLPDSNNLQAKYECQGHSFTFRFESKATHPLVVGPPTEYFCVSIGNVASVTHDHVLKIMRRKLCRHTVF